jgi:hypothetical protein
MTARERYIRSIKGGDVDRFFRYEHGPWPTTRDRWITEGYPPEASFGEFFDMDPIVRIGIHSGYTDSPYYPPFQEQLLEETAEHRTYVGTDGIVKKEFKVRHDTSMPQFVKFPVTCRKEWEEIRKRLNPSDTPARIGDVERVRSQCSRADVPTFLPICGAFGHPRNLCGDEGVSYLLYDDPSLIEEILDGWQDLYEQLLRALTQIVRVDVLLIWEDMCYKNGPLISPEHFKTFMIPRYRRLIETARSCGVEAIMVDTDGDCLKLIPLFLDVGVDCLMPFEVQAGMDVVAIARQYPQLAIMGGIDKRALSQDEGAIRREVDRVVPFFKSRGRFIPTLDHTVPPDVSLSHFQCYLECVRRYE